MLGTTSMLNKLVFSFHLHHNVSRLGPSPTANGLPQSWRSSTLELMNELRLVRAEIDRRLFDLFRVLSSGADGLSRELADYGTRPTNGSSFLLAFESEDDRIAIKAYGILTKARTSGQCLRCCVGIQPIRGLIGRKMTKRLGVRVFI